MRPSQRAWTCAPGRSRKRRQRGRRCAESSPAPRCVTPVSVRNVSAPLEGSDAVTSKMLGAPAAQVAGVNLGVEVLRLRPGLAIDERSAQNVRGAAPSPPPARPPARVNPRRGGASPIRTKSPRALLHPPRRGRRRSARKLAARGARTDGGVRRSLRTQGTRQGRGRCLAAPELTSRNTRPAAGPA